MLQDLIVAAINDAQPQGRRAARPVDERPDGRPEDSRPVLIACPLPEPLARLVEQLQKLPGIGAKGAQRLAFHLLKNPREDAERLCDAIRDVKERVTYCSVCNNITDTDPCVFCTSAGRDQRVICVVEEPQNVTRRREDARVPRRLSRADGRAVAAARRRAGRPEDQGAARPRRRRRRGRSDPRHQSRPSKARRPRSTWRGCSSRSASASRASRWAFPSAPIWNTPTRSR